MSLRRREFIAGLGTAAAWSLAARAQQPRIPVIGFLSPNSPENDKRVVAELRRGLRDAGYIEGQNVTIEFRWANAQRGVLRQLAFELAFQWPLLLRPAHCLRLLRRRRPLRLFRLS